MGNCSSAPAVKDDAPVSRPPPSNVTTETSSPIVEVAASKENLPDRARTHGKKSASLELPKTSEQEFSQEAAEAIAKSSPAEDESVVEFKVRRRVSRRLSLEVKKNPGSKTGSPSPAHMIIPTEAEKAAWDAQADSDMVESKPNILSISKQSSSQEGGSLADLLKGSGGGEVKSGTTNPVTNAKAATRVDPAPTVKPEGEEEGGEVPGTWRVQRRGRRLSLEVKKAPDLALLAAVRRSSSVPLRGQYARNPPGQEIIMKSFDASNDPTAETTRITSVSTVSQSGTVIDFASEGKAVENGAGEEANEEESSSVKAADDLLKAAKEGSPDPFRARRRRSRRLSLEIEKKPDDAVLAAVRRTHSAPITAAAARAAMGEEAWAQVAAGKGDSQGKSPIFEPEPPAYDEPKGVTGAVKAKEKKVEEQKTAWASGQVIDFASDLKLSANQATRNVAKAEEEGKGYVKTSTRRTSRRKSMDIYKKAISSGATEDSATQLAKQVDPEFNLEKYAAEVDSQGGEDDGVLDFSDWSTSTGGTIGVKSKWAELSKKQDEKEAEKTPEALAGISI